MLRRYIRTESKVSSSRYLPVDVSVMTTCFMVHLTDGSAVVRSCGFWFIGVIYDCCHIGITSAECDDHTKHSVESLTVQLEGDSA